MSLSLIEKRLKHLKIKLKLLGVFAYLKHRLEEIYRDIKKEHKELLEAFEALAKKQERAEEKNQQLDEALMRKIEARLEKLEQLFEQFMHALADGRSLHHSDNTWLEALEIQLTEFKHEFDESSGVFAIHCDREMTDDEVEAFVTQKLEKQVQKTMQENQGKQENQENVKANTDEQLQVKSKPEIKKTVAKDIHDTLDLRHISYLNNHIICNLKKTVDCCERKGLRYCLAIKCHNSALISKLQHELDKHLSNHRLGHRIHYLSVAPSLTQSANCLVNSNTLEMFHKKDATSSTPEEPVIQNVPLGMGG